LLNQTLGFISKVKELPSSKSERSHRHWIGRRSSNEEKRKSDSP
jgi:hypothetical protein